MRNAAQHACWSYDQRADFHAYAAEFLAEGLAGGESVWWVGTDAPQITAAIGGRGTFVDVQRAYAASEVMDPAGQVAAFAAACEQAVAAGYAGLRVAADVTSLLGTPEHFDAFARYEVAISDYMLTAPLRGVCGFDRAALGDDRIAQLACLHPHAIGADPPFRLYPATPGLGEFHLDGELDSSTGELFEGALRRAAPGRPFVVNAAGLDFLDHRSLLILERHADRHGISIALRCPHPTLVRLAELLGLERVTVEVIA